MRVYSDSGTNSPFRTRGPGRKLGGMQTTNNR